ncbi:hypothetical protein BJY04DRAFT_200047 [Aspergillus karnatakaensis]|uniref:uncharacterized protein n=1 Tax=Aspergillus karnatakaensis TaxID=1810916 RepID=UPI003CCCDCBE
MATVSMLALPTVVTRLNPCMQRQTASDLAEPTRRGGRSCNRECVQHKGRHKQEVLDRRHGVPGAYRRGDWNFRKARRDKSESTAEEDYIAHLSRVSQQRHCPFPS